MEQLNILLKFIDEIHDDQKDRDAQQAETVLSMLDPIQTEICSIAYLQLVKAGILQNLGKQVFSIFKKQDKTEKGIIIWLCMGQMKIGPIKRLQSIFVELSEQQRESLDKVYVIQPTVFLKTRLLIEGCVVKEMRRVATRIQTFNKFPKFLKQLMHDEPCHEIATKFMKQLPLHILDTFQRELNKLNLQNELNTNNQQDIDFLDYADSLISCCGQLPQQIEGSHCPDQQSYLPMIFQQMQSYFEQDKIRYFNENLLNYLDEKEVYEIEKLEFHLKLGNYKHINSIKDSKIVLHYLISVLRCMEEPLCTSFWFPFFKHICKQLDKAKQSDEILEITKQVIVQLLEPEYQETWKFVLRLLANIVQTKLFTLKMITEKFFGIVFRTPELLSSDQVQWSLFQKLLGIMIQKHEYLFQYDVPSLRESLLKRRQSDEVQNIISNISENSSEDRGFSLSSSDYQFWHADTQQTV
eukprot:403364367